MRQLCCALFITGTLLLGGCGLTVHSDANPELVGNVKCASYAWAGSFRGNSPLRNTVANPVNEERLRQSIANHLTPGGAIQAVGAPADCLVGYGIGNSYVVSGGGWPYYGGWYGYGWGWGPYWGYYDGPYVYDYGIISIDLYEARSGRAIWHASADQSLRYANGPEAQRLIDEAVAAMLAHRPPGV